MIPVVYTGPFSTVEVDHYGLKLERGKEADVPAEFAIEKCARQPTHWKLGAKATAENKKAVAKAKADWTAFRKQEKKELARRTQRHFTTASEQPASK